MSLSIIVAVAQNRVIGNQGQLPWHLSEDLKRFKRITMGHPVVMGRKTHESIGRPLPGRQNIVISRQPGYRADGCDVVGSLAAALAAIDGAEEVFCIGGAEVYREALPMADRLYFTRVLEDSEGDVKFPKWDETLWKLVDSEPGVGTCPHYRFEIWKKRA